VTPNKPRLAKPNLQWRWLRGRWVPFYRVTWTENGRRRSREIKLDWKDDAQELDRLYWIARSGRHEAQKKLARYTWRDCIEAWRQDPAVQRRLAYGTKKSYRPPMDAILEKNGGKDMRQTTRPAIKAALAKLSDTPKKAARFAQTISLLWNYAAHELDWPLGPNPAKKLGQHKPERPFEPWPDWMVAALDSAPEHVQTAAQLIRYTGQRPSAAISMRRDQFRGETMILRDEKGDVDFEVHCPDSLRSYVGGLPRRGAHLIAKNLTTPLSYFAVQAAFSRWRKTLGKAATPYTLHGLRKLAIIELAQAGASDAEIQAITNQSAAMVAYYRQRANRLTLSKAAYERTKNER
jgi:hypothetical protein